MTRVAQLLHAAIVLLPDEPRLTSEYVWALLRTNENKPRSTRRSCMRSASRRSRHSRQPTRKCRRSERSTSCSKGTARRRWRCGTGRARTSHHCLHPETSHCERRSAEWTIDWCCQEWVTLQVAEEDIMSDMGSFYVPIARSGGSDRYGSSL